MKAWQVVVAVIALLAIGVATMIGLLPDETGNEFGRFEPAEFVLIGQPQRLASEFTYIDPEGLRWTAPKNMQTDGASIPPFLWQVVGDPFGGRYLYAAIVHDAYCHEKHYKGERPHEEVHRMFYRACLCAGVEPDKAKLLYAGVHYFGPKWDWPYRTDSTPIVAAPPPGEEPQSPAPGETPDVVVPAWTFDERVSDELIRTKVWKTRTPGDWNRVELSRLDVQREVRTGKMRYNVNAVTTDGRVLTLGVEDQQALEKNVTDAQTELMRRCKEWISSKNPTLEEIEAWDFTLPE